MRHAVIMAFLGKLRDRFCEYQAPIPVEEKLERAAAIPGVQGVELIYPDECADLMGLKGALSRLGLAAAAVNVNLKGHPDFVRGALSSPDPAICRMSLEFIRGAKDCAFTLGCPRVTCAPLADGYDYPLQIDYRTSRTRIVDVLAEACEYRPEITLHLEHKPSDPRTRGLLDTAGRVVLLCRDIGSPAVGITFNVGHAFYGGATPADAFAQVLLARIPYYIHSGDGTDDWDWDLLAGSRHYWQWAEFLYYLKQDGYQGWVTSDAFPVRQDATELFAANIRVADGIWQWLDTVDSAAISQAVENQDLFPVLRLLEQCLPYRGRPCPGPAHAGSPSR
jgi:xylose isomerase